MKSNSLIHKPAFILCGMSGTGKSCFIEDARLMGCKVLRTFNKFLLDVRFGYDKSAHDFLIMDSFMQLYHIQDYDRFDSGNSPLVIERSILDPYFFKTEVNGYIQSDSEIEDMNHIIEMYFKLLLNEGREINLITIINKDKDWITRSLSEEWTRRALWAAADEYIEYQDRFRSWIYYKLIELCIPFNQKVILINNVKLDFTPDMRREFIRTEIVSV